MVPVLVVVRNGLTKIKEKNLTTTNHQFTENCCGVMRLLSTGRQPDVYVQFFPRS
jgi:hypothetical protein